MNTDNKYVTAEGRYLCTVKQPGNGWLGVTTPKEGSGKTPTEFIRVPLIVEDAGDQNGREIVWQGWLTEAAITRTTKTLDDAFGLEWDIKSLADGRASFVGKKCRITVAPDEYNGETRYKIKWLNPAESNAVPEVSPQKVDELARRFATIERTGAKPPAPAMKTKTEDGDDIPF
jgi:hypothetical protein